MFPFEDVIMWWDAIQLLQTQVTNNHFIDWNTFEKYPLYSAHMLIVEVRLYFRVVKQYITTNFLMTSSNENIFCITGPLCGELTGHQWIPLMKASHKSIFLDWLISPWTKWQPFCRQHIQLHFHEWKFVPKGPIDNKSALVHVLAGHPTGNKPLPEQILTHFTDWYMQPKGARS